MPKRKGNLALVEDDMIEDDDDDFDLDEDEEEEEDTEATSDEVEDDFEDDEDDFEDEDDDEEEEASAAPPKPQRKGSKRTPAPTPPPVAEDSEDDEDFDQAVGAPNEPSRSPALRVLNDDALVIELTDLVMQGEDSEMTSILVPVFTGPRGGKIAKKLVREARDRAIAKIKRVADVACVNIDTFSDDED